MSTTDREPVRLKTVAEKQQDEDVAEVVRRLERAIQNVKEFGMTEMHLVLTNGTHTATDWHGVDSLAEKVGMLEAVKHEILMSRFELHLEGE